MPSCIGGDQLDDDYAPWVRTEVKLPTNKTYEFFERGGLNLSKTRFYSHKRDIGYTLDSVVKDSKVATLRPRIGVVELNYGSEDIEHIKAVLEFRGLLNENEIDYRPKEVPPNIVEVISDDLNRVKDLARKVGLI